jgi:hypothetical protein
MVAKKAIDWKPRIFKLTIPPSAEPQVITIDVQPKRGRAYLETPLGATVEVRKALTHATETAKI